MARFLITTFGSLGDLHPYLALGTELQSRGHTVTIATSAFYREQILSVGLGFHAVRPDVDPGDRELLAYVMDKRHGTERILRYLTSLVRESYEDTAAAAQNSDVIVTHPITFGAVLVAQKFGLPWISTVLAPISFLSAYDPPVPAQAPWLVRLRVLGPTFWKWVWAVGQRQTAAWVKPVNILRRELGLAPGGHPLFAGSNSPSLVLAMFSRFLTKPQPDWPLQAVVTGFPFFDRGDLTPELERFLSEGPPPVVFTLGSSAVGAAGNFYVESLEAIGRLKCRAVFLTGSHPQGLPDVLPPAVLAVPYAPHGAIFPRGAAIVHQGGVGTTAQAMRAGRPMLVVPFGHDQFDNAALVKRLGAAEVLYRPRYTGNRVSATLERLMEQASYVNAAAELGAKVRTEDGAVAAADAICERLVGQRRALP